ncbi:UDP-glucose/GDP-mannose dehydrogenase family protein [Candidatus Microgenomates bacterium]|nr:MAG: UDP-glucose/GDP-mannose dehydrogenase family protein [Candidatus Microgenomates bacterium]
MTICFIGHGYVGLVTAAVFADLGNTVWVVGRTPEKINNLKKGVMPFFEPGLEEMVIHNAKKGRLLFTLDYKQAVSPSEVVFIAVGTPPKNNGEADLSQVFAAAEEVGKHLDGYTVVVTKSTVPPGTNRKVGEIVAQSKSIKAEFDIASTPEFLREGSAISDTLEPDRVVIGVESDRAKKIMLNLHKPLKAKNVVTNIETAEMIKYASNSLLSTKISFANSIALLSEKVGADAEKVLEGVGLDRRLGRAFLYPGVGYGGSCFPKDVKALIAISKQFGYDFQLLKAVEEVNREIAEHFIAKIIKNCKPIKGSQIGVLGLAFKPNTDDMREAPSIKIITALTQAGAKVKAYDPVASDNAKKIMPDISYVASAYDAAKGSDALVLVTEWNEFRQLNLSKIKDTLKTPRFFDGRNVYDPEMMKKLGFHYFSVGRT